MKEALKTLAFHLGSKIAYYEQAVSTNDTASRGDYRHGELVVAEFQSAGRGQGGHSWESEEGQNLTFSLVLEPNSISAQEQFLISETVSVALVDTLREYGIGAQVKWTNDIYIGDRKVAGILIENDILDDMVVRSIVGIGLNVNQLTFDMELPNPTSMLIAKGGDTDHSIDRVEVLARFMSAFTLRYVDLLRDPDTIQSEYLSRLYLRNVLHTYRLPDGRTLVGMIREVERTGELVIEESQGSRKGYLFGEIEF